MRAGGEGASSLTGPFLAPAESGAPSATLACVFPLRAAPLSLRAMQPEDAAAVQASRTHPDNVRYQGWRPPTVAEVVDHARRQDPASVGRAVGTVQAVLLEDGAFVGDFGICTTLPLPTVELGVTLAPGQRGRGLAIRGARMLLDGLFAAGVHRVAAVVDPRNAPSLRLFERLGFRREAHAIASYYDEVYDEWADEVSFAMLGRDWIAKAREEG